MGAGLVGSAAALALAGTGHAVQVIEQGTLADDDGPEARALVLAPSSVALLDDLGLWSRLQGSSTPIRRVVVHERGAFGNVRLDAGEFDLEALGWACPARHLLAELHRALVARDGIEISWSTRFESLAGQTEDAAALEVLSEGTRTRVDGALVIAADGSDSPIRGAAGIPVRETDYGQEAIVATATVARPAPDTAYELFTADGPLALIPCGGDRVVSVQCLAGARALVAATLDDADYCEMLTRRSGGRLGAFSHSGPRRSYPLRALHAEHLNHGRVVLVGNAANSVHPNGAQGLNLGLRDVAALRRLARGAVDPGAPAIIEAFVQSRHQDHLGIGRFTDRLARTFSSPYAPVRHARRLGLAALAHSPGLKRDLVARLSGLAVPLPDSRAFS